jgi:hypothetical protein
MPKTEEQPPAQLPPKIEKIVRPVIQGSEIAPAWWLQRRLSGQLGL